MKKSWVWYAALVVACGYGTGRADVKLPNVFSDHAVLQRDEKLPVWGKADPNEKIVVSLAGQTAETTADAAGQWRVVLKPLPAGGPFDLVVTGHNTITRHDILIGEVWLCVGQSNMATSLAGTPYWMKECPAADDADIRFLTVGDGNGGAAAAEPQGDIADTWQRCSPLSAFSFSAIGYFAGQEIHRRLQVPVGLIKAASWGSPAEPFVSREALATATNFAPLLRKLELDTTAYLKTKDKFDADYAAKAKDYEARKEALAKAMRENDLGSQQHWEGPITNAASWIGVRPGDNWDSIAGLKSQAGVAWYRKDFNLPESWVGRDFELWLGGADGESTVFFNREPVAGDAWHCAVPGRLSKSEPSTIAVRVVAYGAGRFGGPEFMMYLAPTGDTQGLRLPMMNDWKCRAGYTVPRDNALHVPAPHVAPAAERAAPGAHYNGMIAPLAGYAMKGVFWYQGESNGDHPQDYQELLTLLIRSWREAWGADWTFILVQLPNFVTVGKPREPTPSTAVPGDLPLIWAPMREAMLKITQTVPKTGMAVTLDIGEAYNIHPDNKKPVGLRLARAALGLAYGLEPVYSGPLYDSMTQMGNGRMRLRFKSAGGGLTARNSPDETLRNFVIAGADRKFVWATAKVIPAAEKGKGIDTVEVWSDAIQAPVAVRYAFWGNPEGCNFYNQEGLPASPFRTDEWPLTTGAESR